MANGLLPNKLKAFTCDDVDLSAWKSSTVGNPHARPEQGHTASLPDHLTLPQLWADVPFTQRPKSLAHDDLTTLVNTPSLTHDAAFLAACTVSLAAGAAHDTTAPLLRTLHAVMALLYTANARLQRRCHRLVTLNAADSLIREKAYQVQAYTPPALGQNLSSDI